MADDTSSGGSMAVATATRWAAMARVDAGARVERTFGGLHRSRRLLWRYERRDAIHEAFLILGGAFISLKALTTWFC